MTSGDIIYDKFHFKHDAKWSGRLGPAEGGGLLLCVACVIEMIESDDVAVKKIKLVLTLSFYFTKMNNCPAWLDDVWVYFILQCFIYD